MKIPRNIGGNDLVKLLIKYDYHKSRQSGSHIRLTRTIEGEHHITIPNHKPIKIGTLNNIFSDLSDHLKISKKELIQALFE